MFSEILLINFLELTFRYMAVPGPLSHFNPGFFFPFVLICKTPFLLAFYMAALGPVSRESSSLSSVPTDASAYKQMHDDADTRLSSYEPSNTDDNSVAILKAFIKYLPQDGRWNICEDVIRCGSNEEIEELAHNLTTTLLIPSIYPPHPSIFHNISL